MYAIRSYYDFRTPERLWRSDLAINPANELSMLFLGDELWRQKRIAEAEEVFLRLLGIAPDFSEAMASYAQMLVENGRYGEAINYAKKAIVYDASRNSKALIPLAGAYLKTGRPNDVVKTLEPARISLGHMPTYWELLGKAMEAKGDRLSALECYLQEVRVAGGRVTDTLQRIGRLQLLMERYADAEESLRRDLELLEIPESWNSLGAALVFQGRTDEARAAFALV